MTVPDLVTGVLFRQAALTRLRPPFRRRVRLLGCADLFVNRHSLIGAVAMHCGIFQDSIEKEGVARKDDVNVRALLRFSAFLAFLAAFVALVADGATIISSRIFTYTAFGELIGRVTGPDSLIRFGESLSRNLHPLAWTLVNTVIFTAPAVIVFALAGIVFFMGGRSDDPDMTLTRSD